MEQLTRLINDGTNTGIYFLWIGALPAQWNVRLFNELPISEGVSFIPYQTEKGCAALTDLLNQEVQAHQRRQEELKQDAIEQQQKQMFEEEAKDAGEEFFIEIGTDTDTGKRALFRLDEEHHVHAFVLGQTGSGKSVFLHTLLNNAMLKYTPESLQFYLMDFKTGGVELNRYRHYPHVRALPVDESDPHITLEILRDITTLMQERGQKMREAGCNNLKSYNAAHPESPMPRIVLLVDECHELFKEGRHKIQTEMDDIVTRIAKQGRSQGVHIIFATQTLTGCSLPRDIIGQITDPYLLKCDAVDAQRFVDNPTPVINALQLHYVAHINKQMNEQEMFLPDFIGGQMDDYLAAIQKKSADIQVNFTPFYFTGTQKYSLVKGLDGLNYRRHPELSLGKSLEVRSKNISLRLRNDMAQNLLIVGSNEQYQGLRILLVSLFSLLHCNAQTSANARFVLFLNDDLIDTPDLEDYIYNLERYGVEICDNQRKRIDCLKELYGRIKQPDNRSVFLFVTNQDGCIELRQNVEIDICSNDGTSASPTDEQKEESNLFFGGNLSFSATPTATSKKNVRTIWKDLLSNAGKRNLHCMANTASR